MKTNNIDSDIKKIINESVDFYDTEANKAKEKIWQLVQLKTKKQNRPFLLRALAAACILLVFLLSFFTISNFKAQKRINVLVELNATLQHQANATKQITSTQQKPLVATTFTVPDTVVIEKKVLVSKPVITTKTDTVYIKQKVYIEKEIPQEIIAAADQSSVADTTSRFIAGNYETKILIRNNESEQKGKKKKLRIKFGGNRNQSGGGTLALTTGL